MGMYTECFVTLTVDKTKAFSRTWHILQALFHGSADTAVAPSELPDHPFFRCQRWTFLGTMSSYYFQPRPQTEVWVDEISKDLHIVSRSDLKNYDDEIAKFFDWLSALDGVEYFGYERYEETPWQVKTYCSESEDE